MAFLALRATTQMQIKILATGLAVGTHWMRPLPGALIVPALITLLGPQTGWAPRWPAHRSSTSRERGR